VGLAEEFRTRAAECFRWSQSARTLESRIHWLSMAQLWLQLAQYAEEKEAVRGNNRARKSEEDGNGASYQSDRSD
jgi:hypothetical protein